MNTASKIVSILIGSVLFYSLVGCGEDEQPPIASTEEIEVEIFFEAANRYQDCYWAAFSQREFCDWFFESFVYEGKITNTSEGEAPFVILKMQVKRGKSEILVAENTRIFRNLRPGEVRSCKGMLDLNEVYFLSDFNGFQFSYKVEVQEELETPQNAKSD